MAIAAIRYNNPGNVSLPIKGWTGGGTVVGIKGQSGYASFPDANTGYAAFSHRVDDYITNKGLTTIRLMNTRYAEDPNWGAGVSRNSGIGIDTPLNVSDQNQMEALRGGILRQETGMTARQLGVTNTAPTGGEPLFLDEQGRGVDANGNVVSGNGVWTGGGTTEGGGTDLGTLHGGGKSQNQSSSSSGSYVSGFTEEVAQALGINLTQATLAAASTAAQTSTANTTAEIAASNAIADMTFGSIRDYFGRFVFILVGLLAVGFALYMLTRK